MYVLNHVFDDYDKRDFKITFRAITLPEFVSHRDKFPACFDQGSLGSCGPQVVASQVLFNDILAERNEDLASRLFVYYNTRVLMGTIRKDSGVQPRTMYKAVSKLGYCNEQLWPYDATPTSKGKNWNKKPPRKAYQDALPNKSIKYLALNQDKVEMCTCLAGNQVFLAGIRVYESFMDAPNGVITLPEMGEKMLGGHAITIVGYDLVEQVFEFRNSWGDWGNSGYGTIPFSYLTDYKLASDFWILEKSK